jgi:hypothetical protein
MDMLIKGLCEVEPLCDGTEPNWLGWSVLGFGIVLGAMVLLYLVADIFSGK